MSTQEVSGTAVVAIPLRSRRTLALPDRAVVAALTALALALRLPTVGRGYWIDEGISVGIASHPVSQIPGLLRHDGSPPLFYLALHYWMSLVGESQTATHLLPLLISLAAVPIGYWAGKEMFDRRAGLAASALLATSPFLAWYSTETRMYTIVVVLSLVSVTFAWKAFRYHRAMDAAASVAGFTLLLYTHDWGIYLLIVTAGVLTGLALVRGERRVAAWVAASFGATVVLWVPWLPTFVSQAHNTAAPWAVSPDIGDFFADPSSVVGGTLGFVVVPLLVLGVWLSRRDRSPSDSYVGGLVGAIGLLTALAGFLAAQIEPSWTLRYLAVVVGPLLLACSGALAPSHRGRVVLTSVCVILVAWSVTGSLLPNRNAEYAKSNVQAVAKAAASQLHPGDLVVVTQTEQVAVLSHYLPAGLEYATPTGPVPDPSYVDWSHIVARLQAARPCQFVAPSIDALPVGSQVLEVDPARALGATGSTWSRAVNSQVLSVDTLLAEDPSLVPVKVYRNALTPKPFSPVFAVLFQKISAGPACA
jgi:hypothetical protein